MHTLRYGQNSDRLIPIKKLLMYASLKAGELEQAEGSALELINSSPSSLDYGDGLSNQAVVKNNQGQYGEAEKLQRNLVSLADSQSWSDWGLPMMNLGVILVEMEKDEEAEEVLRKAYSFNCSTYGESHQWSILASKNHAMALKTLNRLDEAKAQVVGLIMRSREIFGFDHPLPNEVMDTLAQILYEKREYKDARALCVQVLNWRRDTCGPKHRKTLQSLDLIAKLDATEPTDNHDEMPLQSRERLSPQVAQDPDKRMSCNIRSDD